MPEHAESPEKTICSKIQIKEKKLREQEGHEVAVYLIIQTGEKRKE